MKIEDVDQVIAITWRFIQTKMNKELGSLENGTFYTERSMSIARYGEDEKLTYRQLFDRRAEKRNFAVQAIESTELTQLIKALNYIPMSPARVDDHNNCYYIPTYIAEDYRDYFNILKSSECVEINKSKRRIELFREYILERVPELVGGKLNTSNSFQNKTEYTRFFVRGNPGVGKTAFLNYFFSVNATEFLTKKIFWLRVDLNESRGDDPGNLNKLLYEKFVNIFCRFYLYNDKEPFNDDFLKKFCIHIENCLKKSKRFDKNSIKLNASKFVDFLKYAKDKLSTSEEEKKQGINKGKKDICNLAIEYGFDPGVFFEIAEELVVYLQKELKYGYVFMFDGFDNVTIDYAREHLFTKWLKDFRDVTDNSLKSYFAIYIISIRDYSLINLYQKVGKVDDFKELKIVPMDMVEILKKKCELASRKFDIKNFDIVYNRFWLFVKNIVSLINNSGNLNTRPLDVISDENNDKAMKQFCGIANSNFRAALRILRELIILMYSIFHEQTFNILSKKVISEENRVKIQLKKYRILRLLITGDNGATLYKNRVYYTLDIHNSSPILKIENQHKALIPNIFNYMDVGEANQDSVLKNLLKIRIVQYLLSKKDNRATIRELIKYACYIYKVKENLIRYESREMIYNGLLCPDLNSINEATEEGGINFGQLDNYKLDYPVALTYLGKFLYKEMLSRSIYYEVVCDDTPIQSSYLYYVDPYSRFDDEFEKNIGEYLMKKTKSIMCFLYYLMKLEQFECSASRKIEERKRKQLVFDINNNENIIFTLQIQKNIMQSIAAYVFGYIKKKSNNENQVQDYFSSWFKYFDMPAVKG